MNISQFKYFGNIKSQKLVRVNLSEFIGFYFGIFADDYAFYRFLNEYYLTLGYSNNQIDEIWDDFCKNLNNLVDIKIIKINNIYVYSFILDGTKYYEFESFKKF